MKLKCDSSERNSDTEVNIKEDAHLSNFPLQDEGIFLDQDLVSKLSKCNKNSEAETEIKVKEEQWCLESNSTEVKKEFSVSDPTLNKEAEFFCKKFETKLKSERNGDSEINIKEKTIFSNFPFQNEGTLLDQDPESKLGKTEAKIVNKEEEWWLERNSMEIYSACDKAKLQDVKDEHFPYTESPRSQAGATSKSTLFPSEHLGINVFNTRKVISKHGITRNFKTQISDVAKIPSVESSVHSGQHDRRKTACIISTDTNCVSSEIGTQGCKICKKEYFYNLTGKSTTVYNSIHNSIKSYKCDICGKDFTHLSNLKQHNLIHDCNRSHKCDTCGKDFKLLSCLKHHLIHDCNRPHKCDICGKDFKLLSRLKHHHLIHEGKKPYKCNICDKAFNRMSNLKQHSLIHEYNTPHKCDTCGKDFKLLSSLKKHKLIHECKRLHKCDTCGKDFSLLSNLKKHNLIHEGKRPHKCVVCGRDFTHLSNLKEHSLIHEGKRAHKCDTCGKYFTKLSTLKRHNLIHEGKRSHKCNTCGKDFSLLSYLKKHNLIHEGKKPHKCDTCGKDFTRLSNLKRHNLIHKG